MDRRDIETSPAVRVAHGPPDGRFINQQPSLCHLYRNHTDVLDRDPATCDLTFNLGDAILHLCRFGIPVNKKNVAGMVTESLMEPRQELMANTRRFGEHQAIWDWRVLFEQQVEKRQKCFVGWTVRHQGKG